MDEDGSVNTARMLLRGDDHSRSINASDEQDGQDDGPFSEDRGVVGGLAVDDIVPSCSILFTIEYICSILTIGAISCTSYALPINSLKN